MQMIFCIKLHLHKNENMLYLFCVVIFINILICDDRESESEKLAQMTIGSGIEVNIKTFNDSSEAFRFISEGAAVDVCFLDIIMPETNGIALAEKLRAAGYTGEIVFITGSNDFACESYRVNAFSYLLKPLSSDNVRGILEKLDYVLKNKDKEGLLIKTSGAARFIMFRDISYVEVIQHKVYFRLKNGEETETTATFSELSRSFLTNNRFIRCHRSFIVNMDNVSSVTGREIIMRGGARIPISKSFPDVKKKYLQWVFGGKTNE